MLKKKEWSLQRIPVSPWNRWRQCRHHGNSNSPFHSYFSFYSPIRETALLWTWLRTHHGKSQVGKQTQLMLIEGGGGEREFIYCVFQFGLQQIQLFRNLRRYSETILDRNRKKCYYFDFNGRFPVFQYLLELPVLFMFVCFVYIFGLSFFFKLWILSDIPL